MLVIRRGVAKCLRNLSNVVGRYASTQRHTSTASETRNIALVAHIGMETELFSEPRLNIICVRFWQDDLD